MDNNENIAAVLFLKAEQLQNDTRELSSQISQLYANAAALKNLAFAVAQLLNPAPTEGATKGIR